MIKKKYDSSEGVWRTIGGKRVFIKTGQSLSDAMRESGKFKKEKEKSKENIVKQINDLSETELLPKNNKNYFNLQLKDASDEVLASVRDTLLNDYIEPYDKHIFTQKTYNKVFKIYNDINKYLSN